MPNKPQGQYEIDYSVTKVPHTYLFVNQWTDAANSSSTNFSDSGLSVARSNLINDGTGSRGAYFQTDSVSEKSNLTIVSRYKWNTLETRSGVFGESTDLSLNLGYSTSNKLFLYFDGGYVSEFIPAIGAIEAGKFYNFVWTFDGSLTASERVKLWIDGVRQTISWSSDPGTTTPAGMNTFAIADGNENADSETEFFYLTDNTFSEVSAREVSADPYIIIKEVRTVQGATYAALFGSGGIVIPDPDPLDIGLALGSIEYTQGSMYLGDTEIETMFLGGINITQQYVTDENGAYLIDENNNYITYGD